MSIQPFHLAIPVDNIQKTRDFYGKIFGLKEGRSSDHWIDWDFYGHQLVTHLNQNKKHQPINNFVDGKKVPVPHFGIVLKWDDWHNLSEKLKSHNINFVIEPYIRFKGEVGEQATMFFFDPSQNAIEMKAFRDINQLFAK